MLAETLRRMDDTGVRVLDAELVRIDPRLFAADGELPLAEIIAALPAGLAFSVETPNLALLESLGAHEFARRARQAVARLRRWPPPRMAPG